jgi:ATP-dependent DNA ligase
MQYRYPDDPIRITMENLRTMVPGQWVAQKKLDGWRCPAYFSGGKWTYYSKSGERAIMPPEALRRELESLSWPSEVAVDMEWMGPRQVAHLGGRHSFRLFDMLYVNGKWLGDTWFLERHRNLQTVFALAASGKAPASVSVVPVLDGDLVAAFEREKADPLSEGLVIRGAKSGLVGGFHTKGKNAFWRKIKYRDIHEPAVII